MKRFFNPLTVGIMIVLAVTSLMGGGLSDPVTWIISKLMILPAVLIGLSVHEFGHAWTAYKLGDDTPYYQGRVTINPMAHIDPVGFISLMFIGFGWGVPVQIDPGNFRKPRRDEFIVSAAGVVMNLITALVFALIIKLMLTFGYQFMSSTRMGGIILEVMLNVIFINIVLMLFNLLPVPPLDGFNIVTEIFRLRRYQWWYTLYNNGMFILLMLIIFNITDVLLTPGINFMYRMIIGIIL